VRRDANGLFPLFYRLGSGLRLPTWIGDLVAGRADQIAAEGTASSTTRFVNFHGRTPSVVIRARKRERCAGVHYVCLRGYCRIISIAFRNVNRCPGWFAIAASIAACQRLVRRRSRRPALSREQFLVSDSSLEARLTCTLLVWLKLHSCNNVRFAKSVADISQY
jgi:hypothetical protein